MLCSAERPPTEPGCIRCTREEGGNRSRGTMGIGVNCPRSDPGTSLEAKVTCR